MRTQLTAISVADSPPAAGTSGQPLVWPMGSRPLERATSRYSCGRALRLVGLMAFAQSLLFLIVWLLVCVSAGAAPVKKTEFRPELLLSTYEPTKNRDPFGKVGGTTTPEVKSVPGTPFALQLEGILYEAANPSAIVNGRLLTLDKTVTLTAGNGEVAVRAVEITRDHVVVEVGGKRTELRLNSQNPGSR
jgi:hypothetical protein